jgi:hypothetical protein
MRLIILNFFTWRISNAADFPSVLTVALLSRNPKTQPMVPPAPLAGARRLLRRLLSTTTEAVAEAATPPAQASATQAAKKKSAQPLYCQLSALGKAKEGSVSRVMNKWVRDGGAVRVDDLVKHVRDLRKYKRHTHALEVCTPQPYQARASVCFGFRLVHALNILSKWCGR